MLYEFKLGYNTVKTTKNISSAKGEGTIDYSYQKVEEILLKLQEYWLSGKVGRLKTMDSQAVLQLIEANLASSIQRVSGELSISVWLITFVTSAKAYTATKLCLTLSKYYKTYDSVL